VVKSGVLDPDLGGEIGGWQGRIEEVHDGGTVLIRWDCRIHEREWLSWTTPSGRELSN
jgi:hypothetical protein